MPPFTEKKVFTSTVIILLFLIIITHLVGYFNANEEYYYIGSQPTRRGDLPGHFSFIIQAQQGNLLFKNLYNSQEQRALFFHPLWLVMGWTSKIFNSILFTYQFYKVIFVLLFCLAFRKFLKRFFDLEKNIWLFPFCIFAAGFFSWYIEKDTFLNLYYSPLFVLVLVLFILIYYAVWSYFERQRNKELITIFSLSLLLFVVHFYDSISLLVIIFLWSIYRYLRDGKFKQLWPALVVLLATLIGGIYYFYIFSNEPALTRWAVNNVTLMPSWQFFVMVNGLLLPLAIIGAIKERAQSSYLMLIFWVVASLFIIFSPIPFNRRFVLGLSIPLTILSYQGVRFLISKIKNYYWQLAVFFMIILSLIQNNLVMFFMDFEIIRRHGRPQYLERNYMETFIWMKDNLSKESVIFANFDYWDTEISGFTGLVSYWAGGYFSIVKENLDKVFWFFKDNQFTPEKQQFLEQNRISYLFYSIIEKQLGSFNPRNKDYLKLIYKNKDAEVYQVIK